MYKKNIYKSVVVYYWFVVTNASLALPTFLPTFHRSVAWSSERHNTPSYKITVHGGNRTPISRVSTPGRKHLTTLVNPCLAWSDLGYSYPRHLASLSQILRLFVGFKIRVATLQCFFRIRDVSTTNRREGSWLVTILTDNVGRGFPDCRRGFADPSNNSNWQKFIWYLENP